MICKSKLKLLFCLLLFSLTVVITHVFMEEVKGQENGDISISPALYELHSTRDENGSLEATIRNDTESKIKVNITVKNIEIEALIQDDKLKLLDEEDPQKAAYWFKPEQKNVNLGAFSEKKIDLSYKIPGNVELKSYYPVIVYEIEKDNISNIDVNISDRIISIIYLDIAEVKGTYTLSSARISYFKPLKKVVFSPNVQFELKFENTGNTFIHPRGKVHIYDRKGIHLSDTPTINDNFGYLVQGEELEEVLSWVKRDNFRLIPQFGKYTAIAEIYHNNDQENVSSSETEFYIVPIWHILILALLLVIIIGTVMYIIRKRKKGQIIDEE